jgi:hypothetical protein
MKLSTVATVSSIFVASAHAANSDQVAFLTALVEDFKDHKGDYLKFYQTASDVPGVLTSLVKQVGTYKDDSYTTLLDDSALNVGSLSSYATNLPWYTRIASEAGISDADSGSKSSAADSSSASSSSSAGSSSTSGGGAGKMALPVGAIVGAAAVALM